MSWLQLSKITEDEFSHIKFFFIFRYKYEINFPNFRFYMLNPAREHSVQLSRSVMSDSSRSHGLQQARPPCPTPETYSNSCPSHRWCHTTVSSSVLPFFSRLQLFLASDSTAAASKSLQSCPTLCDPIDVSPRGSPVTGILQARTLEWVAISFSNAGKWKVRVKSLSRVRLLATAWTAAHQAPPSMGFSRQEYWSGLHYWKCFPGSSFRVLMAKLYKPFHLHYLKVRNISHFTKNLLLIRPYSFHLKIKVSPWITYFNPISVWFLNIIIKLFWPYIWEFLPVFLLSLSLKKKKKSIACWCN